MNKLQKALIITAMLACIAIAVAATGWGVVGFKIWPTVSRVNRASVTMLDCQYWDEKARVQRSNPNCLPSSFAATTGALRDTAGQVDKALKALTPKAQDAAENSVLASQKTVDVLEAGRTLLANSNGAVTDIRSVIAKLDGTFIELNSAIADIHKDADVLIKSSNSAVIALSSSLSELTLLEQKLGDVVDKLSPEAQAILKRMLDIISDENITKMIGNVQSATKSGADILDTFDKITEPLRKKAALIRTILLKLFGMIHLQISPF